KLTQKQLDAVVCHEISHIKNRHGICLFLISLIQKIFWMIPVLAILKDKIKYKFELKADLATQNFFGNSKYLFQAKQALSDQADTRLEFSLNFSADSSIRQIKNITWQDFLV